MTLPRLDRIRICMKKFPLIPKLVIVIMKTRINRQEIRFQNQIIPKLRPKQTHRRIYRQEGPRVKGQPPTAISFTR